MDSGQYVPMQFSKVLEVFGIVLIPVAIGMMVKSKFPNFAARMEKPVKIASAVILIIIIVSVTIREKQFLADYFTILGLPVLLFNVGSLAVGYFIPRLLNIEKRQAIAIGMEIGIHNGILALAQITQRPIIPVGARISRKYTLNSWDQFQVPLPFSRCDLYIGPPLVVPPNASDGEKELIRGELEKRLDELNGG